MKYLRLSTSILALLPTIAFAIVIRPGVPDSEYRVLDSALPALVDLPGEGQGVLIAPRWVVTAAHATQGYMLMRVQVHGEWRDVSHVFLYPGFKKEYDKVKRAAEHPTLKNWPTLEAAFTSMHDIALIELAKPVEGVKPVALYQATNEQDKTVKLFGKGATGTTLPQCLRNGEVESSLNDLHEILIEELPTVASPDIDVINGLGGILAYSSLRRTESGMELRLIIKRRCLSIIEHWLNAKSTSGEYSKQFENLGVAHGMPGLLLSFAGCFRGRLDIRECLLLREAARKIWSFRIEHVEGVLFPSNSSSKVPARLAWCYGALGICLLFDELARLSSEFKVELESTCLGALAQLASVEHRMRDASVCYGHAGAALILKILSKSDHLTDEIRSRCATAAVEQYQVANLLSLEGRVNHFFNGEYRLDYSLLEGVAGVAMAMATFDGEIDSVWTRVIGIYS